ncbi:TonB-dependent receptor [Chitinophaga silvatica]|uniref:TonB-dependent receptor n=1 Tax=Chitinophaga silvatica TaxID=2282649 RepID=A0A3E1YI53_9BACT|nr:carboxypeptidase regulatory-like domain-containing protein [Chitinophaga silvatica]RFS27042.1 TonB-dependent receptor [Chitinophaga silvatica]
MKRIFYIFGLLICFFLQVQHLMGQETNGSLSGKVLNDKNEPQIGVTVLAIHEPSGTRYGIVTGTDGRYFLPNLRIGGPYTVTASMMGMETQKKEQIVIRLGEPLTLNFTLSATSTNLSGVTVTGTRKSGTANTFGAGQNISRTQLNNMPTISRSIQDITKMVPQSTRDNSFAGTNFRYNNVTIDGAINNDAIGFSPSMGGITGSSGMPGSSTRTNAVSLDAIEDMQVYLAPFDVKIGNFTGGSINAVTRSGTNKVTGSVYAFGRNAALMGKSPVGKMNSDFHDYQAGFRVGFPIIKNKLFFFTNEEITSRQDPAQLKVGQSETAQIFTVKDAIEIREATLARTNNKFDPGTAGDFLAYSKSQKFFNRLDWNISDKHQLSVRNNTILSTAVNMDRDQQDFRFSSMAYQQVNNQTSTVMELKSRFNSRWSNSFIAGFSVVNDKRNPEADPSLPQVQIMGRTPGTTIYLGTDREASIFNMKQRTIEITENLTFRSGKHTILLGTHNELYHIDYGFVNSWNGRVDYLSIDDYLNNIPYRVRGSYNYNNNDRNYILANPEARFNVNMNSLYFQDEIQLTDKFKLIPGLRADYSWLPEKPELSEKTQNANTDNYFGNTYTYTPLNRINNGYLNKVQVSPRLGFRFDWLGDQRLILRGGTGFFTGRIPFAWIAYAYYNNGINYGSYDQKADSKVFTPGSDPLLGGNNGIAQFILKNGAVVNNPNAGKTQVDVIDNNFVLPQVWRNSVAVDYTSDAGFKYTVEGMFTKTIKDVLFQQINIQDNPTYYGFDKQREQPVYSGTIDPRFSNAYLLSNTNKGYRYSITGSVNRSFNNGLQFSLAYTYGGSKDVSNGIRNSMESNWQLNQALNPNNPGLAWSNFDIRHRIVTNINYRKNWNATWNSTFTLFASAQSGSPFTYGVVNNSIQGLPQQVSLLYIPSREEAVRFFRDTKDQTAQQQADAFNAYIDGNKYLRSRRGGFTERNAARTPWNVQADFHFAQEYHFGKQYITFTVDILNLTHLVNNNWGISYFSPNTFNSTASAGLTPVFPASQQPGGYPVYGFMDPGTPYSIDFLNSRSQVQLGLRYSF